MVILCEVGDEDDAGGEVQGAMPGSVEKVHDLKEEVVITKHGKPMARLVPLKTKPDNLFGAMRGQIEILGDLVAPITEPHEWNDSIFPEENVPDTFRKKNSQKALGRGKNAHAR